MSLGHGDGPGPAVRHPALGLNGTINDFWRFLGPKIPQIYRVVLGLVSLSHGLVPRGYLRLERRRLTAQIRGKLKVV